MAQNTSKNRKSESQELFEQAENAGRFSGNNADARTARRKAEENIIQDAQSLREERNQNENTDAEAGREPSQTHDYKGESQNVNDDNGRPLNEEELNKARNKANEGLKQGRNES